MRRPAAMLEPPRPSMPPALRPRSIASELPGLAYASCAAVGHAYSKRPRRSRHLRFSGSKLRKLYAHFFQGRMKQRQPANGVRRIVIVVLETLYRCFLLRDASLHQSNVSDRSSKYRFHGLTFGAVQC
jgi:hypothetical protein